MMLTFDRQYNSTMLGSDEHAHTHTQMNNGLERPSPYSPVLMVWRDLVLTVRCLQISALLYERFLPSEIMDSDLRDSPELVS
jgi:hypothetical protein